MGGKQVVVSLPRWVLVTAAVVLTIALSGVAVAAVVSRQTPTATATLPPVYAPPSVGPAAGTAAAPDPEVTTDVVADPITAPVEEPAPVAPVAPAAPTKPAVVCPVGHLSGGVLSATVGPGLTPSEARITVTSYVRNDANTHVILFRHDTPDVKGYDATGGVPIIELYGDWANSARDSFAIQPGESLNYVTAWTVTQQQLDAVIALYASPDIGSLIAAWPTTEQLAACGSPLPNAGSGTDFPY